jgi:hypothetical protein
MFTRCTRTAVYVIAWSARGPSKIGIAVRPAQRLNELQTCHPYRLKIYFAGMFPDRDSALKVEQRTLAVSTERLQGEWIMLPPNQAAEAVKATCQTLGIAWNTWRATGIERETRDRQLSGVKGRIKRAEAAMAEYVRLHDETGRFDIS